MPQVTCGNLNTIYSVLIKPLDFAAVILRLVFIFRIFSGFCQFYDRLKRSTRIGTAKVYVREAVDCIETQSSYSKLLITIIGEHIAQNVCNIAIPTIRCTTVFYHGIRFVVLWDNLIYRSNLPLMAVARLWYSFSLVFVCVCVYMWREEFLLVPFSDRQIPLCDRGRHTTHVQAIFIVTCHGCFQTRRYHPLHHVLFFSNSF